MQRILWDRVDIYVNGSAYLPDGSIRNFSMDASYNSQQKQGFTPDGTPAGQVVGNSVINAVRWEEYLPPASEYVNWRQFLLANPSTQAVVIPVTLATGVQVAQEFVISGILIAGINISAPTEGEAIVRICTFNAASSSGT